MEIEIVDRPEKAFPRPVERVRRLFFDNDADQDCFRIMYNALAFCEQMHKDVRVMFISTRLLTKLDKFSVAAPNEVPAINLRRQRMLPPYPGHPISLDLTLPEMSLIELCLQLVPWGLEEARQAAKAYEFMLRSDLVDVDLLEEHNREVEKAYDTGLLVDSEGQKIK